MGQRCHRNQPRRVRDGGEPTRPRPAWRDRGRGAAEGGRPARKRRKEKKGGGRTMASGWGINGNKGRCYDFWLDFSECMSRCRQPSDCGLLREDYLECLHHSKEVRSYLPLVCSPARPSVGFLHFIRFGRLRFRTLASDPHRSSLVLAVCVRLPRSAALLAPVLSHA